jgi:hypothetical protein
VRASTEPIQSRMASLVASLSVREPESTGIDVRPEHLHADDVEVLPADILGAHVDVALEPEVRGSGGARDAVLPGAGLGDDALLAHALGEQGLAEGVVDLVGAGVGEVLALEPDGGAAGGLGDRAGVLGEPVGAVEGRGPANEGAVEVLELVPEVVVDAGLGVDLAELGERGDEGLGDEDAAVVAESAEVVGDGRNRACGCGGHGGCSPENGSVGQALSVGSVARLSEVSRSARRAARSPAVSRTKRVITSPTAKNPKSSASEAGMP